MTVRPLRALAALLVSQAAHISQAVAFPSSPRDRVAAETWESRRSMNAVASCVVRSLDDRIKAMGLLEPATTHQVNRVEAGRVVEVVHPRAFFIPTEFYFVRVISEAGRSRLELYVVPEWAGKLEDAVAKCAS